MVLFLSTGRVGRLRGNRLGFGRAIWRIRPLLNELVQAGQAVEMIDLAGMWVFEGGHPGCFFRRRV